MKGSWKKIAQHISKATGKTIHFNNKESVSGGCINQTLKLTDTNEKHWFIKTNSPSLLNMFTAEAEGLNEIYNSHSIRTPRVICYGTTDEFSYLVLEHIPLRSQTNQTEAGKQLAQMHQTHASQFGWKQDNTIGSTPQSNQLNSDWVSFWKNERLLFQLKLAKNKGYQTKAYEAGLVLADNLPAFFTGYRPQASLLQGDLWGGNCASDATGNPVIYDPAVYFGDRETDIAMTELFGGFSAEFYVAYNAHNHLDSDYKIRRNLYNLYHILNHFNLFGGGYASQAANMTQQLLSEI